MRKAALAAIGILALGAINLSTAASAHNGPEVCAFTSAAGLPANINNVEGKGAPWSIGSDGYWAGTGGPDGDPMTAQATDGFGHAGPPAQIIQGTRRGLYYPATDPHIAHLGLSGNPVGNNPGLPSFIGDHFNWTNIDVCNNNGVAVNTRGVGVGYCGRSVGLGVGTTGDHNAIVKWESFGSQLYLTDASATGTLNAQPNPPGSAAGSCLTGQAVTFNLNGALVHR